MTLQDQISSLAKTVGALVKGDDEFHGNQWTSGGRSTYRPGGRTSVTSRKEDKAATQKHDAKMAAAVGQKSLPGGRVVNYGRGMSAYRAPVQRESYAQIATHLRSNASNYSSSQGYGPEQGKVIEHQGTIKSGENTYDVRLFGTAENPSHVIIYQK